MNESLFVGDFMLFVASTHILGIHDLAVVFTAEYAEFYVQPQKKAPHGGQLFVVLFGQCVGYLLAGKHLYVSYLTSFPVQLDSSSILSCSRARCKSTHR